MSSDQGLGLSAKALALPGRGPGRMAFLEFGPAVRPVDAVFLHANGFNALTYRRILWPLASRYRIIAIDQRGHGDSTLTADPAGRRDWLDLRDDLLAFLRALGPGRVVLSGHSMGGTVSLLAAAAQSNVCGRLVLFDPVALPPGHGPIPEGSPMVQAAARRRSMFASREEAMASYMGRGAFRTWPTPILADYVAGGFHDRPDGGVVLACAPAWEASGYASHGHDPWAALDRTTCPVEILCAEAASTFHMGSSTRIDGSRVTITTIPGSTHFLPMERPDVVQATLSKAIEADRADGG